MDDAISRRAAVDTVREIIDDTPDNELPLEDVAFRDGVQYAISVLSTMPSAQPQIIRCKDCKYFCQPLYSKEYCGLHVETVYCNEDDFCSWAERKTE